jgi:hypothetical protein
LHEQRIKNVNPNETILSSIYFMLAGSGCASGADQSIVRTQIAVEMQQTALSLQQSQVTTARYVFLAHGKGKAVLRNGFLARDL